MENSEKTETAVAGKVIVHITKIMFQGGKHLWRITAYRPDLLLFFLF